MKGSSQETNRVIVKLFLQLIWVLLSQVNYGIKFKIKYKNMYKYLLNMKNYLSF